MPQGTPADIVRRLNREINAGLASTKIQSQLTELGSTPLVTSAEAFGAFMRSETEKWEKVVKVSSTEVE